MTTTVYIAGASAEWERAKARMDWVRSEPGLELAHDWVADVVKHRVNGGKSDADLTDEQRFKLASYDMAAVGTCDIFWLLVPDAGVLTVGAWVELGAAIAEMRKVIVSGARHGEHLFCSLADVVCHDDSGAQMWIQTER